MAESEDPGSNDGRHTVSVRSRFHLDLADACGIGPEASLELLAAPQDDGPPSEPAPAPRPAPQPATGNRLRYQHLGQVGQGGMGTVLEVFDSNLRRRVATKVMLPPKGPSKSAADAEHRRMSSRFLEEAQINGQLEHPGIVPVYDLGLDETKQLYFTMRLVRGKTFTKVIELVAAGDESWNLTRALGVLLKVCDTMHYAHDKGVLHRDLKPDNVMVGRYGEVYVLDWGLARVQGREDSREVAPKSDTVFSLETERKELGADSPLVTMDGTVMGTPHYMPREQAVGRKDRMGPRSDVYSVGAMLYHLLSGTMPYHTPGDTTSAHTILAMLIQAPPRAVHELAPDTPAELIAICERAMGREPEERYASMAELADDLRAYLEHRVVGAYETGAWAELKKWVGRNRPLAASISATVLVALFGVSAIGLVQARGRSELQVLNGRLEQANLDLAGANEELQATNEELDAALSTSRRVEAFLIDMFQQQDPDFARGETITVKEVLDREVTRIRTQLLEEPAVHARLMGSMGRVYQQLALHQEARPLLRDALRTTLELYGPDDERTWQAQEDLGGELIETRELEQARELLEAAYEGRRQELGELDPATLSALFRLGTLSYWEGDLESASELFEQVLTDQASVLGPDHGSTLETRRNLAALRVVQGRTREAVEDYREILEVMEAKQGEDARDTLFASSNLAFALGVVGDFEEAEALSRRVLELRTQVLGPDHPDTLTSLHNLAEVQFGLNQLEDSAANYRRAWRQRALRLGPAARPTLNSLWSLAVVESRRGRTSEATQLAEQLVERARAAARRDDELFARGLRHLIEAYGAQGRSAEVQALRRELQDLEAPR